MSPFRVKPSTGKKIHREGMNMIITKTELAEKLAELWVDRNKYSCAYKASVDNCIQTCHDIVTSYDDGMISRDELLYRCNQTIKIMEV
jgi:hypothetical protein